MLRRVLTCSVLGVVILALGGCGFFQKPQRPAWRDQAEKVCLAQKRVQFSAYVQPAREIDGPGICGLVTPLKVTRLAGGAVELSSTQTIGCPLTAALDQWVQEVVQPVARARFGVPVIRISSMGSFACRPIDNIRGAKLSEHSFGNALDIGGFRLADGREITLVKHWTRGDEQEKAFLREVHAGACNFFTTVLGPGSDAFHYNHIHVDLAAHGNTNTGPRRFCRPLPKPTLTPVPRFDDGLPAAPDIDDELDVARARNGLPPRARTAVAISRTELPPVSSRPVGGAMNVHGAPPLAAAGGPPLRLQARSLATIRDDGAFDPGDIGD
jgi:hypothetical protein